MIKSFQHLKQRGITVMSMLLLPGAALLAGCSNQVSVRSSWQDNAPRNQSFKRVLVVGVSPDINQRCTFEYFLVSRIRSETTTAIASCDAVAEKNPLTRASIDLAVASQKADAVLATILVAKSYDVKEGGSGDTRGDARYKATDFGFASGYYGNYGVYGIPVVYGEFQTSPALTELRGEVEIATTLYETSGATLLYTMDTRARDLYSREAALADITAPIADRLRREGLIR